MVGGTMPFSTSLRVMNRATIRRRDRQMPWFMSLQQAQRFLLAPTMIYGPLRPRRHLMAAAQVSPHSRQRLLDLAA
jgi:hypothetical protein